MLLHYSTAKGLHRNDRLWSISLPLIGHAFELEPLPDGSRVRLDNLGLLTVPPGYLWDGSSGPTIDGEADPVPSLVHDVLYEAMRCGKLHKSVRAQADAIYREMLVQRKMSKARAWVRYAGLRLFGGFAAARMRGPQYPKRVAR